MRKLILGWIAFATLLVEPVSAEENYIASTHIYKSVDGHDILVDVFRPEIDTEKVRPAIVFLHAGALIFGFRGWIPPWQLQIYIDAGFILASIDYRLAPETKLPEILADVEDAYYWVRDEGAEQFNIDPERIAIVGHSAGGYLALSLGHRVEPRPRAVISFYGYGDVTGDWYSEPSDVYNEEPEISENQARSFVGNKVISGTPFDMEHQRGDFYVWCRQRGTWPVEVSGRNPKTDLEWFKSFEPIRNINSDYPPTFLLHGGKDTDVPYDQSAKMAEVLESEGIPYELKTDPEWEHMFDGPALTPELQAVFSEVVDFLVRHTR
jgi:acetyl esterase/lipase